jgi:hypothetical protein
MLRTSKSGNQKPWTLEELSSGLQHFFNEKKRYPTAPEIDTFKYLPSARTIERSFGGLVALRKQLKLKTDFDLRSGQHSSKRARTINERAQKTEQVVYDYLKKHFGTEFVHREYFFTDDKRTRADFFIHDAQKGFCVDVFYPSDRRNLIGCLNSKLNKYTDDLMRQYPIIFLQMNKSMNQKILDSIIINKKKRLAEGQTLMSWELFQDFCKSRTPLHVSKN